MDTRECCTTFVTGMNQIKNSIDQIQIQRGVGIKKGLEILSMVKEQFGCPVTSDIHEVSQCKVAKKYIPPNIYR